MQTKGIVILPSPEIRIAYEYFDNILTFGIEEIDGFLRLTIGESLCIASNNNEKYMQTLLARLCIHALLPKRHGGFESSKVIFVDAGNSLDFYQYVNFARQYGVDIEKVLQSIIVSRVFTICQLANMVIYELPKVIQQFAAKVVVISDILDMFVNDPQIEIKEAKYIIK